MGPRSFRILEILRETIGRAEQTPELGPHDPGVVELRRLLMKWVDEHDAASGNVLSPRSDPTVATDAHRQKL
jgi:hypothetical protein